MKLTNGDRTFFVWLYRLFPSVLSTLVLIRPQTLIRGRRDGFRHLICGQAPELMAPRPAMMMGRSAVSSRSAARATADRLGLLLVAGKIENSSSANTGAFVSMGIRSAGHSTTTEPARPEVAMRKACRIVSGALSARTNIQKTSSQKIVLRPKHNPPGAPPTPQGRYTTN